MFFACFWIGPKSQKRHFWGVSGPPFLRGIFVKNACLLPREPFLGFFTFFGGLEKGGF